MYDFIIFTVLYIIGCIEVFSFQSNNADSGGETVCQHMAP
jgi:hypothetical protein